MHHVVIDVDNVPCDRADVSELHVQDAADRAKVRLVRHNDMIHWQKLNRKFKM